MLPNVFSGSSLLEQAYNIALSQTGCIIISLVHHYMVIRWLPNSSLRLYPPMPNFLFKIANGLIILLLLNSSL